MKKKILMLSLPLMLIAGAFVLYSFIPNAKNMNDGGNSYAIMTIVRDQYNATMYGTDGTTTDLKPVGTVPGLGDRMKANSITIANKMNDLKTQGYELVSSNSEGILTNYIFEKK